MPNYVTNSAYVYFTDTRDPTPNEPDVVATGVTSVNWPVPWWNQATGDVFIYKGTNSSGLVWYKSVDSNNLSSLLSALNIFAQTPRSRTQRSSPEFSTAYCASTTRDAEVNANIQFSSLLSLSAQVDAQISLDGSTNWSTILTHKENITVAATLVRPFTFTVPVNSYYRFVLTGNNTTIISLLELLK